MVVIKKLCVKTTDLISDWLEGIVIYVIEIYSFQCPLMLFTRNIQVNTSKRSNSRFKIPKNTETTTTQTYEVVTK